MKPFVLVLVLAACSGRAGDIKPPGTEGGVCYGNGTCNQGLVCDGEHCVQPVPLGGDCIENDRTLLWWTSFENGESEPPLISGDGGPVAASDARSGTLLASVDSGVMVIETPTWDISAYRQIIFAFWLNNVPCGLDSRIDVTAHGDEGSTTADPVSLESGNAWYVETGYLAVPSGSTQVHLELRVTAPDGWADIDDLEVFAAVPVVPCNVPAGCGDGVPRAPEECDDGNLVPTDGCTSRCELEIQGPGGRSCTAAAVLELVAGPDDTLVALAEGLGYVDTDAIDSSCAPGLGDEIYEIFLPDTRDLLATVAPTNDVDPAIAVRGPGRAACLDDGAELACENRGTAGAASSVALSGLESDVYFIIVDSVDVAGTYRLEVVAR